ncbi:monocarboxylate transporter 12-like [Uranotaenia lowii]|uniref:monocarboxylate transporter 12-like n=1 Tax=Uranotaenia lowii TaxID=190385 RepID=UPI00247AA3AD|nr:monocarboxylate transporter 12-like [Uranotaenia lowii]
MTHGPPASRKRPAAQNGGGNGVDPEGQHNPQTQTQMEESGLPTPPDGGWGWMVVLASFCIHIVTDGLTYSFGIFYVEFLDYFKEGKGYTAWIASILVGVTLCSVLGALSWKMKRMCNGTIKPFLGKDKDIPETEKAIFTKVALKFHKRKGLRL